MDFCISSETMKYSDAMTIENGISSIELMNRAALSVFESYQFANKKIAILCGGGNNGGDGYALANVLLDNNIKSNIFMLTEPKTDSAKYYYNRLKERDFSNFYSYTEITFDYDVIVDCIFGVGFSRELSEDLKLYFKNINENFHNDVLAVDIPSGLNSDNGIGKDALKATLTIAIQAYKLGHFLSDAKDKCGNLIVKDIGIKVLGEKYNIVDENLIKEIFPPKLQNSNKGTYGKSVLIGGCSNYIGATKLASIAQSSLRMGCGLAVLAVPSSLIHAVADVVVDNTLFELADNEGHIVYDKPSLDALMNGTASIGIGMGMGNNFDENIKVIEYILNNFDGNLLLDADALNSLVNHVDLLDRAKCNVIITPHPKEMARLCESSLVEILKNPLNYAKDFAKQHNITVLLKGTSTIIANSNITYLMVDGHASMAKGGSGDVLSGVITGIMARNIDPILAGACGSYICAKANDIACQEFDEYSVLASDYAKLVGRALKSILVK